jgi:molybdopterin synthase sulfur carrier subunit
MKVTVKYFASIREATGIISEVVELSCTPATVYQLRDQLASRNENLAEALSTNRTVRFAVDQQMRPGTFLLSEGAEVAFFPPVTGG